MTRGAGKNGGEQLGFDMGMLLPKFVPSPGVEMERKKPSIPKKTEMPPSQSPAAEELPPILSVAVLTRRITQLLEDGIGMVWVEGEISNLRRQASGHLYFTLKDETAQLSCVLFARTSAGRGRVELRDGLQVQLYGQISVYQPRGQYQLMVRLVQAKGEGMLQARFEELKRRLESEGLFDQERKRPLPRFPRRIGVVTSPTGAAIRDFLNVLHRRHPGLHVVISPVRVQGKGAAAEIAAAISEFSLGSDAIGPVDVIVVTRGGGSLEDLWEFNEEVVARAIAASAIPVVSAVGHEIDFSIADFVADLRAATPSAAAELLAADGAELLEKCRSLVSRIGREARGILEQHQRQLSHFHDSTLFREPLRRLEESRQTSDRIQDILSASLNRRLEQLTAILSTATAQLAAAHPARRSEIMMQKFASLGGYLEHHTRHRLDRDQGRVARLHSTLAALSPEATLARGFSITRDSQGKVITAAGQVCVGQKIRTRLARGEIVSDVEEAKSSAE